MLKKLCLMIVILAAPLVHAEKAKILGSTALSYYDRLPMSDLLVRVLGWHATVLHGDPQTYARWTWFRKHLLSGPIRVLDAGCGSGAFTMAAARRGNDALGLSFD